MHLLSLRAYLLPDDAMLALSALAVAGQTDPAILAGVLGCDARYVTGWAQALAELYYGEETSAVAALALPRRVADLTAAETGALFTVPGIADPVLLRQACGDLLAALAPAPALAAVAK